jgi:putative redox protein
MIRLKNIDRFFQHDITGDIVDGRQEVEINWRAGKFIMDEPVFNGGNDNGPDPFTAVIAGLVACTLTTLRMYIRRKQWDIRDIHVAANMEQQQEPLKTQISRSVTFGQPVTPEQYERLLHVAINCPVAKLLTGEIEIQTDMKSAGTA